MFDQKVIISEQFPIEQKARRHTDVCCTIIGALFALSLFITALIVFNPSKYNERFAIEEVNSCKSGFLHYIDLGKDKNKVCLNACPQGFGATEDNVCIPYDSKLQEIYYRNTDIIRQGNNKGFAKTLFYAFVISFGVGLIWMVFVCVMSKYAPAAAAIGAIFSLLLLIIFTLLSTSNFWNEVTNLKIFVILIASILIFIIAVILFSYGGQLKFQGILLKYSNIFLRESQLTFIYIPIFIILSGGLSALIWFQNMAFQSKFATNNNPWDYSNSGFLGVLNILQFIWGFQFLRDSFNFCVAGNAVDWYWKEKFSTFSSLMRLSCRHWGSVTGGSFLNAFFQIPTLIVQLLTCHPEACCSKMGTVCSNVCYPFTSFFELVRTDAYSYINLSGIPFCNSARNCNHLCSKSTQFIGNHSSIKHYRFVSTVFLVTLISFMTQFILSYRTLSTNYWNLSIGVIMIYMTVTWFIQIHTSSAEGLQTSYLVELQLQEGYKFMRKILPSIRNELQFLNSQQKHDGTC